MPIFANPLINISACFAVFNWRSVNTPASLAFSHTSHTPGNTFASNPLMPGASISEVT